MINLSNSYNNFDKLNLINLSKLFHKYVQLLFENLAKRNFENLLNLFDKFENVLAQTARAVFHSAVMLCVNFPPFAQMICACCISEKC